MSLVNTADTIDAYFEHVPIIDLKNIRSQDPAERRQIADEIRNACIQVGFFYAINHGLCEKKAQGAVGVAKRFFSLPLEAKMKIDNRKTPNFKGYSPLLSGNNSNTEGAGDLQEGFEFGWEDLAKENNVGESSGAMAGANVWPDEKLVPGFRQAVLDYYYPAVSLGKALFPIFALALNLPEYFFDDKTGHSGAMMKLLHYPPQRGPIDERVLGIGAHTDWECFTLLWQQPGVQALQLLNQDKQWINAPPIPGSLVVNLGDQFARWTNDIFKSTVHRAINRSGVRRYSMPMFFGTDYNVTLEPISSCISADRPPRYKAVTAGEYVKSRLQAAYKAHAAHGPVH